jgi:predicted transcriptional regulator
MARKRSSTLTEREAQILEVVWRLGEATAEEVREALPDAIHDSTVRTLLRVMVGKGQLALKQRRKAYVYRPRLDRLVAQKHALRDVIGRFFGGSARDLVVRLVEDEQLTPEDLAMLQTMPRRKPDEARPTGGRKA